MDRIWVLPGVPMYTFLLFIRNYRNDRYVLNEKYVLILWVEKVLKRYIFIYLFRWSDLICTEKHTLIHKILYFTIVIYRRGGEVNESEKNTVIKWSKHVFFFFNLILKKESRDILLPIRFLFVFSFLSPL